MAKFTRLFAAVLASSIILSEARIASAAAVAASAFRVQPVGVPGAAGASFGAATLGVSGTGLSLSLPASQSLAMPSLQPGFSAGVHAAAAFGQESARVSAQPSAQAVGYSAGASALRGSAVQAAPAATFAPAKASALEKSPRTSSRKPFSVDGAQAPAAKPSLFARLSGLSSLNSAAREAGLSKAFDGASVSGRDSAAVSPSARVSGTASSLNRFSPSANLSAADNAGKPEPSVPGTSSAPESAPKSPRNWVKRGAWIAAGAAALAGLVAYGPALMHWAESFGENLDLSGSLSVTTMAIAFAGGLLSFLSPCTLPLIPAYMSFISGMSFQEIKADPKTASKRTMMGSFAFVAGFAVVFTALGATATALGTLLITYMPYLMKGAGVIVAIMGLHIMGVLQIALLYRQKRMDMAAMKSKSPFIKAFLMGLAFALGWTPCIGPILAAILGMAAMGETVWQGIALLLAYSAGLGLPFIMAAFFAQRFTQFFNKYKHYIGVGEKITGGLLVLVGILMFFGGLQQIAGFFGF